MKIVLCQQVKHAQLHTCFILTKTPEIIKKQRVRLYTDHASASDEMVLYF